MNVSLSSGYNSTWNYTAILKIFSLLSKNLRARDRLVKIIQYGCQMLMGYYGKTLLLRYLANIAFTRKTASTARKAFWLLKWIHHVNETKKLIIVEAFSPETNLARRFDIIQQFSWFVYFYFENLVLLARMGLFGLKEEKLEFWTNLSWLIGDTACLAADVTRYVNNIIKRRKVEQIIRKNAQIRIDKTAIKSIPSSDNHTISTLPPGFISTELVDEYKRLRDQVYPLQLSVAIAIFELGVSLQYGGIVKALSGRDLTDGPIGLMGVISSALILIEGYINAKAVVYRNVAN